MSGWKPSLVALALTAWFASSAEAQGVVPGGWAPQFGYQSFGVSGMGVGIGGYGFGYGVPGAGYSPYGVGGIAPLPPPILQLTPSSQAVNALDPLTGAIRQSVRRKNRR